MNDTIDDLLDLVRTLRAPGGCPWDQKQTLGSVRAYLLEEAHEAADALDRVVDGDDAASLRDELGDLLFQIAFLAVLAEERGDFRFADAVRSVYRKMVDRHPHVFGAEAAPADADEVARRWEQRKAGERRQAEERGGEGGDPGRSLLDGVPTSLPALVAAYRLGQKAGGAGFDWPDLAPVFHKVREELKEVEAEVEVMVEADVRESDGDSSADGELDRERHRRLESEVGDLLFAVSNLARHLDVDPEAALARTNRTFRRRFGAVEAGLRARGIALADASLEEMEELWQAAKQDEARTRGEHA